MFFFLSIVRVCQCIVLILWMSVCSKDPNFDVAVQFFWNNPHLYWGDIWFWECLVWSPRLNGSHHIYSNGCSCVVGSWGAPPGNWATCMQRNWSAVVDKIILQNYSNLFAFKKYTCESSWSSWKMISCPAPVCRMENRVWSSKAKVLLMTKVHLNYYWHVIGGLASLTWTFAFLFVIYMLRPTVW